MPRTYVHPSRNASEDDKTAPTLSIRTARKQRLRRRRAALRATSSEPGWVHASAYLAVSGVNLSIPSVTRSVRTPGQRVSLAFRLSRRQAARVRRALSRGRPAHVAATIAAADPAGNVTPARHLRIRLRP